MVNEFLSFPDMPAMRNSPLLSDSNSYLWTFLDRCDDTLIVTAL